MPIRTEDEIRAELDRLVKMAEEDYKADTIDEAIMLQTKRETLEWVLCGDA